MKIRLTASEFCLSNRELIDIEDARGVRIEARSGALWVTQDGDLLDRVLKAGESWTIERPGRVVAQALRASRVSVAPAAASAEVSRIAVRARASAPGTAPLAAA